MMKRLCCLLVACVALLSAANAIESVYPPLPSAQESAIRTDLGDSVFMEFMDSVTKSILTSREFSVAVSYTKACLVATIDGGAVKKSCVRVLDRIRRAGYTVSGGALASNSMATQAGPASPRRRQWNSGGSGGSAQSDIRCEIVLVEHVARCNSLVKVDDLILCWGRIGQALCKEKTGSPLCDRVHDTNNAGGGWQQQQQQHPPLPFYANNGRAFLSCNGPNCCNNGPNCQFQQQQSSFDPYQVCTTWLSNGQPLPSNTSLVYDPATITENFAYLDRSSAPLIISWEL